MGEPTMPDEPDDLLYCPLILDVTPATAPPPVPLGSGPTPDDLLALIRQLRLIVETLQGCVDNQNLVIKQLIEDAAGQKVVNGIFAKRLAELTERSEVAAVRLDILAAPALDLGAFGPGPHTAAGPGPAGLLEEMAKGQRMSAEILKDLSERVEALERGFE
jgi:hypothetical protein